MDTVNDATTSGGRDGGRIIPPDLYKAAVEGNFQHLKASNKGPLEELITPVENTILHIYIASPNKSTFSNKTEKATVFVGEILGDCASLLTKVNDRGDTPLHLAAKFGHLDIVKMLIGWPEAHPEDVESDSGDGEAAKLRMLRMKNKLGNTALHEAVKNYYPKVVELLTKEDPHYSYSANDSFESRLFIAVEVRSLSIVEIILQNCKSPSHGGPDGNTSLHVAVRSNNLAITQAIISKAKPEERSNLTNAEDSNGWTPLHYAAYYGHDSMAKYLLGCDGDVAFIGDKERQMTPLHMAAGQGHVKVMKEIILCRPDCCEQVDVKGWNFLHFALAALTSDRLDDLFDKNFNFNLYKNLINAKDREGNTPLHVYAVCQPYLVSRFIFEMYYEFRSDALNNENNSILDIRSYGSPKLQKEIDELKFAGKGPYRKGVIRTNDRWTSDFKTRMDQGRQAQLVVAALVATVTFGAALAVPGGFNQKEGTAILIKSKAFGAFIMADTIATIFSLFAVFIHFVIILDLEGYGHLFPFTIFSTILAILAMVIAFVTGTYAILTPSLGLPVATTCMGLSLFVLLVGMTGVGCYHFIY